MGRIDVANLNSLDLNLIRVFDALLKERSATRAGERIGLSQPAVSAALGRLRHAFNDQLFVRNGNEMLPTPRAESLAEPVRSALATLEKALEPRGPFEPGQLERIYTLLGADFLSMHFMPRFSAKLAAVAPKVKLRLLDSARGDVAKLLQDDAIDVALERPLDMPEWVSSTLLFRSPFAVIASSRNTRLAKLRARQGGTIPLKMFCELSHVIRSIDGSMAGLTDEALRREGMKREVVLALPHFQAVGLAVAQSELIACVPRQFAELAAGELGLSIWRPPIKIAVPEIKMYWHSRHDDEKQHRWFRSQIVALIKELRFDRAVEEDK
jgi:DNA-binding transcriptional LysR family regulator